MSVCSPGESLTFFSLLSLLLRLGFSLLDVFLLSPPTHFCLLASVLLRWLRCCSSVWQPSYFWGIPWVWRGASIRFSPSLYKPSGLDGRQSVRRGHRSRQRGRIRVSTRGGGQGPQLPKQATVSLLLHYGIVSVPRAQSGQAKTESPWSRNLSAVALFRDGLAAVLGRARLDAS